ncbi:MAG: peptidyl-prolyl cis-trans isomerase [Alphaproteobacteria bacterium]|nr:peptidyl-prolyl cis-trans isomerase [Alphaproteobacteria bacterium]
MQKKYVFATTAALVVLIAGAFTYKVSAEKNNGVAAVVNGEKITVAEVREAYDQNPQLHAQVTFEDFYAHALDVIVNGKLALQAATAANIQASPEYQKQLALVQDEVARQVYIEQQVNAKVTDAEIRKVYDEYVANFKSEKEITAKHILVDDEAQAKEIIAKLDAKEASFVELAQKYSKDQPDLGSFTAEMMVPEFSNAAFAMEKGTYSKEPVKTEFGYHVILVEEIGETKPLEFDAVKEQIKANLSQQAVAEIVKELNDKAQIEKFDLEGKKMENTPAVEAAPAE